MSRQGRVYFQNAVYHISIRGNNRQSILDNDMDKHSFLKTLSKFKFRMKFKLHGFVLMDNHAHLIICANSKNNISKIMQAITLSYSVKFRRRYPYTGYVWQGRFKSNVITNERYILECLDYIHNNPIRAGIVEKVEDYLWSSYHFYNSCMDPLGKYIQVDKVVV